ncbi:MAG: glycoside hydrolase family 9 protein [Bacteroidetes bacterium]|nr:glycoside hydrolase family 9 protein [Bacteroidota bacterium]
MKFLTILLTVLFFSVSLSNAQDQSWIRINQLGYTPSGTKVAVWCSQTVAILKSFQLVDATTKKIVFSGNAGKPFGAYGPYTQSYRLNFSSFNKPGKYYLQAGGAKSPEFEISSTVYNGAADFCLRYMRQQRTGFNPFLNDSCHTHDGYVLYGQKAGIADSTYINVVGGWHDASDYLQYATTSANATYHLLAAYRDFPKVFKDEKLANGLTGKNGVADVLDEAKWGLDWLLKMHPKDDWMFNQIGDDRDHMGMRIPKEDTNFYGKGLERPVYFLTGEPQQRGKYMNVTTGTSSTAGKFAGAFALGYQLFVNNADYQKTLLQKSQSAYNYALKKIGYTQTASVRSPYIYAEENYFDDLEFAAAMLSQNNPKANKETLLNKSIEYSKGETITPWLIKDTAAHYQWYPFINVGHYELAKQLNGAKRNQVVEYYKQGIEYVWNRAKQNAFYRGVPYIWCSNNLTTSFAIQCLWYQQLSNDHTFDELAQANIDWLFGCNPWGTSMVYGLPSWGDTPTDPHSAFTHIKNYPIDGGLIDGPVYGSIYKNLIGITLYKPDAYAAFQSGLAVYHDDYGDYSTNEPTMDGTASLIYLLAAQEASATKNNSYQYNHGAIIRGNSSQKNIALVFTGHEFAEGGNLIAQTLKKEKVKASFFLTGDFYRNKAFEKIIKQLKNNGNYLGMHSNKHLLYCDWNKRDSLLISKEQFENDILQNRAEQKRFKIKNRQEFFLPPYEWYNDVVAQWAKNMDMQLVNFTPGTLSNADYTTLSDKNYRSSDEIYNSILKYEQTHPSGLNGFLLLTHIGAGDGRTDKFFTKLPELIQYLKSKGYQFKRIDELLDNE